MDENNGQQMPKEPTKKQKAQQAGKDVAEIAAKGAANYFGGPLGGAVANKIAQTKLGQNVLNSAGKNISRNPIAKNALSKAQPAIQQAKPMLDTASNGLGGNSIGPKANMGTDSSIGDSTKSNGTSPSNPLSSLFGGKTNNSGFGNNKSGLFSNSSGQNVSASGDFVQMAKKAKTVIGIISAIAPIVLPVIVVLLIVAMIMSQIMVVSEFLGKISTGIEKFINFAQGDGWLTNEEFFFAHLQKEYDNFSKTVTEGELDIPLVAATIHYSKVVDTDIMSETNISEDGNYEEQFGQFLEKDQTAAFYNIAEDKLGSVNSIFPGEKKLLGHLVETTVRIKFVNWNTAKTEWEQFFNLINQSIQSTAEDSPLSKLNPVTSIASFLDNFNIIRQYAESTGGINAAGEYDGANLIYECQEFLHVFEEAYASLSGLKTDENGEYTEEQKGAFPTPVVTRTMNYGYDEYKKMQEDMIEIKAILRSNGESVKSNSDALKKAKKSSNTKLQELYNDYKKNELEYEYSYIHYLQKVYIPFTYFYGESPSDEEIDKIVDEIYDQRSFYNYLTNEGSVKYGLQLGTNGYQIRVSAPTQDNPYFNYPYVGTNIGQCVWYVKGRATEIIANAQTTEEKKQKALQTMKTMYGNGNQWFSEHLTSVFGSSQDYSQPRPGAIAVYDWTSPDEKGNNYGHSIIVEKVEGNTVYISEGWNSCNGAYGEDSWDCVGFSYHSLTVEQMKNLGKSKYKFIGYVYLLD